LIIAFVDVNKTYLILSYLIYYFPENIATELYCYAKPAW